jgi:predicted SnoaL-like aldol condensation-catalyzing enzyme
MESRKVLVIAFLQLAASGRVRDAFDKHVAKGFRHHNPFFLGDAEALISAMEENARQNPDKRLDVLRALEDGDLVAVHSHVRQNPADRGAAVVHMFRFDSDRIVELWDVGQLVPAESANANGMFLTMIGIRTTACVRGAGRRRAVRTS